MEGVYVRVIPAYLRHVSAHAHVRTYVLYMYKCTYEYGSRECRNVIVYCFSPLPRLAQKAILSTSGEVYAVDLSTKRSGSGLDVIHGPTTKNEVSALSERALQPVISTEPRGHEVRVQRSRARIENGASSEPVGSVPGS